MIFLDTSFLIAYYNKDDNNHGRALKLMSIISSYDYGEFIISDYIFDEFVTITFIRLKNHKKAIEIGNDLLFFTNSYFINEGIFDKSWDIFKNQKKTKLSFTDCTIVALMEELGIKYVATFDEEFKKISSIKVISEK